MSDQGRDVGRGMYGTARTVRPIPPKGGRRRCPRGHDLAIGGVQSGYSHRHRLDTVTCGACWDLGLAGASWCELDPADQHTDADAPDAGLVLVRIPPAVRAGVGQVQLRLDGVAVGDADLAVCGPCRRAVLEQVRVDEPHRRLGYGRVLVAAALAVAPPAEVHEGGYDWSTTAVVGTPATRAFWAAVGWPGRLGRPDHCTDMLRATGELPPW